MKRDEEKNHVSLITFHSVRQRSRFGPAAADIDLHLFQVRFFQVNIGVIGQLDDVGQQIGQFTTQFGAVFVQGKLLRSAGERPSLINRLVCPQILINRPATSPTSSVNRM